MAKLWEHYTHKDLVKNNPVLSLKDIEKIFNLFWHHSKDGKVCQIREIVKTADMLNYKEKNSIFYQCLMKLDKEFPGK